MAYRRTTRDKRKIIIIGSVVAFLIVTATTFGVVFGVPGIVDSDSEETKPTVDTREDWSTLTSSEPISPRKYWDIIKETDSMDSNKEVNVLVINKFVISEELLKKAYANMLSESADLSSINELRLPYKLKNKTTEDKVKNLLHLTSFNNNDIGYILHKEDYNENDATRGTNSTSEYEDQKIVEIDLPENTDKLPDYAFYDNKIKKVNWSELTKLKSLGKYVFFNNRLAGDLDLSALTSLTSIGDEAFIGNRIKGTLTLPPKIETIGIRAFNSIDNSKNKINGTLKLPKSLKSIGSFAFYLNEIEVLDWSEADSLVDIQNNAFGTNKIKMLDFKTNTLPKLNKIGVAAFLSNPGQGDGDLITEDFTLPSSLLTIGAGAIKVKSGITISVSANATGVSEDSFLFDDTTTKITIKRG